MSLDLKRYISATNILIVIIILTFIIQTWDDGYREAFRFSITEVINQPYRIFTHVFLHGHPIHLFQNMYALFIFGNLLESKFNSKELLKLFEYKYRSIFYKNESSNCFDTFFNLRSFRYI